MYNSNHNLRWHVTVDATESHATVDEILQRLHDFSHARMYVHTHCVCINERKNTCKHSAANL